MLMPSMQNTDAHVTHKYVHFALQGMQSERQLSMDATNVLKRCCAIIDTEYGTNFAARDAECEWEGAQLLGGLLRLGLPSAADTCEPGESWCYPPL